MKKLLILLALPLIFSACLKDDEDKFNKSASERLEEAVKESITVLQGAENGWRMELYPEKERSYGGYTLFVKFNADNTVVASSENFAANKTVKSLYSVKSESGPMLAFDTENEVVHFYSSPATGAEKGYGTANGGLEGDFDFIVMEATPDFVKLKGRKTNNYAYLYPIEAGVNWTTEMQAYKKIADQMALLVFTRCIVDGTTYAVDMDFAINRFTSRVLRIAPTSGASATDAVGAPFVVTKTGIKFLTPQTIGSKTVSELTLKEGYYLENEDGSVKITSPKPIHSNNKLTIGFPKVTFRKATISFTPSVAADHYYYGVYGKAGVAGLSDIDLIRLIVSDIYSYVGRYAPDFLLQNLCPAGSYSTSLKGLSPSTEYIVIACGVTLSPEGDVFLVTTDLFKKEFKTEKVPAMSDAYRAWNGTWKVTSTSSEVKGAPVSFNVQFNAEDIEKTYEVTGWDISSVRTNYDAIAQFNAKDGSFVIKDEQNLGADSNGNLVLLSRAITDAGGGLLGGGNDALTGVINKDGTGTVTGLSGEYRDGTPFTVGTVAIFVEVSPGRYGSYGPATGFESGDFPIGPFTMKKLSSGIYEKSAAKSALSLTMPQLPMSIHPMLTSAPLYKTGMSKESAVRQ